MKPKLTQKSTRLKIYRPNTLALPVLYESDIWPILKKDMWGLKTTAMKFFRTTVGFNSLYLQRNEDILEELGVESKI